MVILAIIYIWNTQRRKHDAKARERGITTWNLFPDGVYFYYWIGYIQNAALGNACSARTSNNII